MGNFDLGWYADWLVKNAATVTIVFYWLDKIVKATPWSQDDLVVDVIWKGLKGLVSFRKGSTPTQ